jgi:hypothetical protein
MALSARDRDDSRACSNSFSNWGSDCFQFDSVSSLIPAAEQAALLVSPVSSASISTETVAGVFFVGLAMENLILEKGDYLDSADSLSAVPY